MPVCRRTVVESLNLIMQGRVYKSCWKRANALTLYKGVYLQVISVGVIGSSAEWGGGRIKAVVERGECKWKERKSKKINV